MGLDAPHYQYPEDIPFLAGDIGGLVLAVRRNTPAVNVSADGNYAPLAVDRYGQLRVTVVPPGVPGDIDPGSRWQASVAPASAMLATLTQPAPGVGKRLIVDSISAEVNGSMRLFTVTSGTVIWQTRASTPATNIQFNGALVGAVNAAVVFAFDAPAGAGNFESIAATGYVVSV